MSAVNWLVVTGEYAPQRGGVGDYTRLITQSLARAGDRVTVCVPSSEVSGRDMTAVHVLKLPDRFGPRAVRLVNRWLSANPDARILLQYVPQAFGWRAMNLPFCLWLRSRRKVGIWVMFHEVAFPVSPDQTIALNVLGHVNRTMASLVCRSAERVFVSIGAWEPLLASSVRPGTRITWLPVPSTVQSVDDQPGVAAVCRAYGRGSALVGHVGTYGELVAPMLTQALEALLAASDCRVLLMGRGSDRFARTFAEGHESPATRVWGVGELPPGDLSRHVSACDLLMQPYPDGVTTRRTSAMIGLSHGRALVTTDGPLTDVVWRDAPGVVLTPVDDAAALGTAAAMLAADPRRTATLGTEALQFYDARFDIRHTISALRSAVVEPRQLNVA